MAGQYALRAVQGQTRSGQRCVGAMMRLMNSRTPITLIGPGAIGCAVAGGLIAAGHQPVIAGRTAFDRLRLTTPEGTIDEAISCITDPGAAAPSDAVVLAVKAHQTDGARAWLQATVDDDSTIYICQNGVEHVERLRAIVGDGPTLVPVVVALPANRSEPGVCTVSGRSRLTVPEGDGGRRLDDLLDGSFVEVTVSDDWTTAAWIKLMLNAASGGICTLARTDNRLFIEDDASAALAVEVMAEVAAVGRAEGADLADDLPERILAGLAKSASGHMSSIVVDRIGGVATEWDARNAVVGRLGRRHGIETPLNDTLTTLIRAGEPTG